MPISDEALFDQCGDQLLDFRTGTVRVVRTSDFMFGNTRWVG